MPVETLPPTMPRISAPTELSVVPSSPAKVSTPRSLPEKSARLLPIVDDLDLANVRCGAVLPEYRAKVCSGALVEYIWRIPLADPPMEIGVV